MAEIVNLRKFRKQKARADKKALAADKRARSGQTKPARRRQTIEADRAARDLDGKHLKPETD